MKVGTLLPHLLATFGESTSLEAGLSKTLTRLVTLTGAWAGGLAFSPSGGPPCTVTAGRRMSPVLDAWLRDRLDRRVGRLKVAILRELPSGWRGPGGPVIVQAALGKRRRRVGQLLLLGRGGRGGFHRSPLPPSVVEELGSALELVWRHQGEALRLREEFAALYRTSQLIIARLDLSSVLETISRAVTVVVGSTGCCIGLLDPDGRRITLAAAHGFRTEEWRSLSLAVGEGIIGRCVLKGTAIQVDDMQADPRSAGRDIDQLEGIRSMLSVPLRVGGKIIGVLTAFCTEPHAFTAHHQTVEVFADQAAIAIQNARLFEESVRRARETQALLEAGRAVSRSLEVEVTIRVILEQARQVLGVESCGLMILDPLTEELSSVGSLDLAEEVLGRVRVKVGEGVTGLAVKEGRPVQSEDLYNDPRVLFPDLPKAKGLRSMLSIPLLVGGRATGALIVFRRDAHRFTEEEQHLLSAFADQAAIALEHARLYSSVKSYTEQLESMVAERTRELNEQKRFVEVVLETLPLGLYVLDDRLTVVTTNPAGAGALSCEAGRGGSFLSLVPEAQRPQVRRFLEEVLAFKKVSQEEAELELSGQSKTLRLTAVPLGSDAAPATHVVLILEDITLQKKLARQMLLTERLTTAGQLAAGVAHELNNPLATIAGCAEALKERARAPELAALPAFQDFPPYLALVEEEAYRCKEITGSLLQFVRDPGSRRAPIDLNVLAAKALELLRHQAWFSAAHCLTELDPALPLVLANEGQLRQVFLAIAANALEAMEGKGILKVRTRRLPGDEIEVEFEDQGPGIPNELLPRIFDPFFTTKPPGQGTGLGLAIAQGIVVDHGGRIEVTSRPGQGTRFRVILPVTPEGSRR